ncbi:MAG: PIN domain-containing protein [Jatrophihabitantaceae bacterium]
MTASWFVDTNVAVYLLDDAEPAKQQIARELFDSDSVEHLVVSAQVLGEFYIATTRKLGHGEDVVRAAIAELSSFPVVPTDLGLVRAGIDTAQRHQLSYWDALIIEAAAAANCDRILTEDLNAGEIIRGVRVVNPFA